MSLNLNSNERLIAPCGMNCGICYAYLREKNQCFGCNFEGGHKPKSCINCVIKNCEHIKTSPSGFCYECEKFPCTRLKQLDKRYRTKYRMSMIENLNKIKAFGLPKFLIEENKKWKCSNCGSQLSAHRENCMRCGVLNSCSI